MLMSNQDDAAISDLLNMKSRLERSIQDLSEVREEVKRKVEEVRERKINLRKEKLDIYQRIYRAKIALVDMKKNCDSLDEYFKAIGEIYAKTEIEIRDSTKLIELEESIKSLNTNFERAINFYCDDSLQMELMKRTNVVRELRVEYTQLEQDFNDVVRRLELQKKQQEQRKLVELEKAKQEETRLKRLEEEKVREAEEHQRELVRHQSSIPRPHQQSFRSIVASTELGQTKFGIQANSTPETFKSPILQAQQPKSNGDSSYPEQCPSPVETSFSQFLRWD